MSKPCEIPGKIRAREEVEAFKEHLQARKYSINTIKAYTGNLQRFLTFIEDRGISDVRSVGRNDYKAYQAVLAASSYSPQSVHAFLRAVRRFFGYLERTGRILINPTEDIPYPKLGNRLPGNILTLTEVRRLLDAPDTGTPTGIRDRAILEAFYSTGIRIGELCALTVHDVDLSGGYVRINQGKGGKDRVVPLGRHATAYMKEYLCHVRSRWTRKRREERALFLGERCHRPLNPRILGDLITQYAEAAGIKKTITAHSLRHTCATHMLAGGADIVYVQRLLGHADITTTQRYTRVARRELHRTHADCHPGGKHSMPEAFKKPRDYFKRS